jgi:hypothetical protein
MDSLQFQKVELADSRPTCVSCKSTIQNSYFHLAGRTICPTCAELARASQGRPGNTGVLRGFLFGLGAAVACAIGYAVISIATNLQFALIAILVGYLVGRAVRIGSGGLGGRRCQILAVVLTYLAITTSDIPLIIKGAREAAKKEEATKGPAPVQPAKPIATPQVAIALVVLTGIAIASPFLQLADGVSGILGAVILAVGLMQAWKQTKRDERLLMGPYTVSEGQALG